MGKTLYGQGGTPTRYGLSLFVHGHAKSKPKIKGDKQK